jgi:quercetin dioxygenase-like cupin family protein
MKISSFNDDLTFNPDRIMTSVVLVSDFSKEIRILLASGQIMKEHKAAFPIVIHLLSGEIDLGVEGQIHALKSGDIVTLAPNVPHDLTAKQDSVVRLTLSKFDAAERVEGVAKKS